MSKLAVQITASGNRGEFSLCMQSMAIRVQGKEEQPCHASLRQSLRKSNHKSHFYSVPGMKFGAKFIFVSSEECHVKLSRVLLTVGLTIQQVAPTLEPVNLLSLCLVGYRSLLA